MAVSYPDICGNRGGLHVVKKKKKVILKYLNTQVCVAFIWTATLFEVNAFLAYFEIV